MKSSITEINHLSDDEFIDVENDSDSEQISQNAAEKTIVPVKKFDEKSMDKKSITSSHNNKTTPHSTDTNKKDDLRDILLGVMNKMFSARVVLKRLPNPAIIKIEPPKKPNTRKLSKRTCEVTNSRNENKKNFVIKKTAFINEGTNYVRKCPKCEMPPTVRKTQHCHDCNVGLIYECLKCHEQFEKYTRVLGHLDNKCSIKGYYHCPECDYKTIFPAKIKSHMARLHPSVKYNKKTLKWTDAKMVMTHECSKCGKKFDTHDFLNKHIPMCNRAQEMVTVKNPNEKVRINKDFQKMIIRFCAKCNKDMKVYDCGVSSLQPCQKCGSAMKFKCSRCDKQYDQYCSVQYHTKICGEVPPTSRKWHPRYSIKKTINCPHCNQPFVQKKWLKKHLLNCKVLHRKPREHIIHKHLKAICKNCDEVQNTPDRRKICAQCKSDLQFRCKICDKKFTADKWCKHFKAYYDWVKYECNDCGVGLLSRKALLVHLKMCNINSVTFHCDLCDFTTKLKSSLYRHILFRHPVLVA